MERQNRTMDAPRALILACELDEAGGFGPADLLAEAALAVVDAIDEIGCDVAGVDWIERTVRQRPYREPLQIGQDPLQKIVKDGGAHQRPRDARTANHFFGFELHSRVRQRRIVETDDLNVQKMRGLRPFRRFQQAQRAVDVDRAGRRDEVRQPDAATASDRRARRCMNYGVDALQSLLHALAGGEIACRPLNRRITPRRAREHAHGMAPRKKLRNEVTTEMTGAAGHQSDSHERRWSKRREGSNPSCSTRTSGSGSER